MKNYLDMNNLYIVDEIQNVKEGIQIASQLLEKNEYTDANYSKAVIKNFEKYGKNFIISPYIILPHARPEQGVIKNGFSIVLVKKPLFCEDAKATVRLIIVLAARSSKDHLDFLKYFASILNDDTKISTILQAKEKHDLYEGFI